MPRAGAKLRQRHAQKPVRAASTTKPKETRGRRNWHLHKSAHNEKGDNWNNTQCYSRVNSQNIRHKQGKWLPEEWEFGADSCAWTHRFAAGPLRCCGFQVLDILE